MFHAHIKSLLRLFLLQCPVGMEEHLPAHKMEGSNISSIAFGV